MEITKENKKLKCYTYKQTNKQTKWLQYSATLPAAE